MDYKTVLDFWYPSEGFQKFWFSGKRDRRVDQDITHKFESYLNKLENGELESWEVSLEGLLGIVLLSDQIIRNVDRFYERDRKPIFDAISKKAAYDYMELSKKSNHNPSLEHFIFILMPFRHSSELQDREYVFEYLDEFYSKERAAEEKKLDLYNRFVSASKRGIEIIKKMKC